MVEVLRTVDDVAQNEVLDALDGLKHDDAVSANNNHADFVALRCRDLLDSIVQRDIHEGIISTEDAGHLPVSIHFN